LLQGGEDGTDCLAGGAFGAVERVDVAAGVDAAERAKDDGWVAASGPAREERNAPAGCDHLGDDGELVDAVNQVKPMVGSSADRLDGRHQREAVMHGDPRFVGDVARSQLAFGGQRVIDGYGDVERLME
jgi:hypothetical protein